MRKGTRVLLEGGRVTGVVVTSNRRGHSLIEIRKGAKLIECASSYYHSEVPSNYPNKGVGKFAWVSNKILEKSTLPSIFFVNLEGTDKTQVASILRQLDNKGCDSRGNECTSVHTTYGHALAIVSQMYGIVVRDSEAWLITNVEEIPKKAIHYDIKFIPVYQYVNRGKSKMISHYDAHIAWKGTPTPNKVKEKANVSQIEEDSISEAIPLIKRKKDQRRKKKLPIFIK